MNDRQLCETLLGLEKPWKVSDVEVSHERQRVDIQLEHDQGMCFSCPECATVSPLYDHARERVWRHLDAFEFHTYIHARAPRFTRERHECSAWSME